MSKAQHTPEHTCCGMKFDGFRSHRCGKPAKVQDDKGSWYCGIHSPEAKARREAKRDDSTKKWLAKIEADTTARKRADVCVNACEGISTEALEAGVVSKQLFNDTARELANNIELVRKLREALKSLYDVLAPAEVDFTEKEQMAMDKACALLDKGE